MEPTGQPPDRLGSKEIIVETPTPYPVDLTIDYPERPLNRLTTAFRVFTVIPIAIVIFLVSGGGDSQGQSSGGSAVAGGGLVVAATVLMIVFRQKYPRWWFDWNVALTG